MVAHWGPRAVLRSYAELDRRVWILAVARAINTMGFSMVMPFMAMYIVEQRGGHGSTYGTIYLASGIAASVSHAVGGELADRLGRRRVMVSALLVRAVNMVALGAAVLGHASLAVLGALIVLNGLLRAQFEPAAAAAVTDLTPPDRRVAAFGLQRMGVNAGWALGPALGGGLATVSYGTLFFVAAGATLVTALFVVRIHDAPRAPPPAPAPTRATLGVGEALRENRSFVTYLVLVLCGAALTVQLFSTLSVFAKTELHLSRAHIGLIYTINGMLVLLLQVPAVALIDQGGPRRALVLGPLLYVLGYVAIGLATGFTTLALAVAFITAGEVVFAPALSDMAAHLGDPARLGRAFGLFGLMQQAGFSVGPLLGGFAYDHLRHRHLVMWGTLAGAMAVVGLGYAAFARQLPRRRPLSR